MACDTLEEFQSLEKYRKSFNGDLMAAKSRPIKLAVLESFKFEKDNKGWCLALGYVDTELMNKLKANAAKLAAVGTLKLEEDGKLVARLKSGKLTQDQLAKALTLAQVRRDCEVLEAGEDREANEDEDVEEPRGDKPLPGKLVDAGEAMDKTVKALESFFRDRVAALKWHESEIRTQQDAEKKITEIKGVIDGLEKLIEASNTKAKELRNQLKELTKDKQVAQYSKGQITKLTKAIEGQESTVEKLGQQIEAQKRKLPELELLARKHGASRHGAQTDLALQARRAATGGVTPDQGDNVHGTSESRVSDGGDALTELKWNKLVIKVNGKKREVVNKVEVVKHLLTELDKLDKVATDTASKFHSHELEQEAVTRALAKVKTECVWTEILEGQAWKPLDTVTVFLGPPRRSAGWGVSMSRKSDPKKTVDEANKAIEAYRKDGDTKKLLAALDVAMTTAPDGSVPMVKSCRVTLGRTSSGWTSITHFPDSSATPAGWSLTGSFVRKNASSPKLAAPAGATP